MPAYEEPPVLPGGSFLISRRLLRDILQRDKTPALVHFCVQAGFVIGNIAL